MKKIGTAASLLDRVEVLLRWASVTGDDMSANSQRAAMDDVERLFACCLAFLASTSELLLSAAGKLEMATWQQELLDLRNDDPMLSYLWAARHTATHDSLVTSDHAMVGVSFDIVDPLKYRLVTRGFRAESDPSAEQLRLFCFLHGVASMDELKGRPEVKPSEIQAAKAGVAIKVSKSLGLREFATSTRSSKPRLIAAPTTHLGQAIPNVAEETVTAAVAFYRAKHRELVAALAAETSQTATVIA